MYGIFPFLVSFLILLPFETLAASNYCDEASATEETEIALKLLNSQGSRTRAYNIGFSYGLSAYGIYQLILSQNASSDTTGDKENEKALNLVSGVRSTLGGIRTFLQPLKFDYNFKNIDGESACAINKKTIAIYRKNLHYQQSMSLLRPIINSMIALGVTTSIYVGAYESWASARSDAIKYIIGSQLKIYLRPQGLKSSFNNISQAHLQPHLDLESQKLGLEFAIRF